jgi:cation diffusion facilitator family transporter
MKHAATAPTPYGHSHVFLGAGHERNERKTWMVIGLCSAMMLVEIVGGALYGSLALVADGLHMSTHAGAILIAALAYTYARRHANDSRFAFGTGKLGDLAGFSSAIVLAMVAALIGYEAVMRFLSPVPIHFAEAIPIAVIGLMVNIASAWLLSGGDHPGHGHGHGHDHGEDQSSHGHDHDHDHGEDQSSPDRAAHAHGHAHSARDQGHNLSGHDHDHSHGQASRAAAPRATGSSPANRDNSIRSAYVHVIADAAVSVLAITGLVLARSFGWMWMDPLAGIIGALVIANWSYSLIRDTGRILLDMNPDPRMTEKMREAIEADGDRLLDLHLWRLGPGHLGAVVSVLTDKPRDCAFYQARLKGYESLSHVTVEVTNTARRTPG